MIALGYDAMYRDNLLGVKIGVVYDARPVQTNVDTISFDFACWVFVDEICEAATMQWQSTRWEGFYNKHGCPPH